MGEFVVRCRGLPFSAKEKEVTEFLGGKGITRVQLTNTRDGRPSGEAFVEFEDEQSFSDALSKDRQHMGNRYIEVFASTKADLIRCSSNEMYPGGNVKEDMPSFGPNYGGVSRDQNIPMLDNVVRLRGLPFQCTKNEIEQFMGGLSIAPDGIIFPHERLGRRSTGEAYVFFTDGGSVTKALEKNKQNIQHRYIEVFASSRADLIRALDGNSGGDSGSWAGYGGGRGGGYEDAYGYGGPRGAGGAHRPTPYDRPTGGYGAGGPGGYGGDRAAPYERYDNGRGYGGGGYNDYYARGYEGGYGYENGDWGGYEASYDYGGRRGGGGPMRGGRGGGVDNWRGPIGPRMGGGPMGGGGGGGMGGKGGLAIKMRGIPFRASEGEIYEFFAPLRPSSIEMVREASGRPSGEARVEFGSRQEYDDALLKDKQYMGTRYVELFPDHH